MERGRARFETWLERGPASGLQLLVTPRGRLCSPRYPFPDHVVPWSGTLASLAPFLTGGGRWRLTIRREHTGEILRRKYVSVSEDGTLLA